LYAIFSARLALPHPKRTQIMRDQSKPSVIKNDNKIARAVGAVYYDQRT
jgi:hypothetical protein